MKGQVQILAKQPIGLKWNSPGHLCPGLMVQQLTQSRIKISRLYQIGN